MSADDLMATVPPVAPTDGSDAPWRARRTGRLLLALVFSMEASIDERMGEGHTFEKDENTKNVEGKLREKKC